MQGEGRAQEIDGHRAIGRKIASREMAVGRALCGHLIRLEQNIVWVGLGEYGVAEVVLGSGRGPSAAPTALHGEVAQTFLQWALGQFAGNNLPS
jgi:hypothetical protein